jgi:PAP2 superfamily
MCLHWLVRRATAELRRRDGLRQIAIILTAVWAYEIARRLIEPNWPVAMENAKRIAELERALSLAWEKSVQRAFLEIPHLVEAMNLFYFVGHFLLTAIFFFWLYHRSRDGYRSFRNGFMAATGLAVVIHWAFPTAPPRLLADLGIADTLRLFWDLNIGSPQDEAMSNPVAAVPSLHAGWALGVGVGLVRFAKQRWLQVLGVLYPAAVLLTIVVTGNHFIFDALAGMAVLAAGFMVIRVARMSRCRLSYTGCA